MNVAHTTLACGMPRLVIQFKAAHLNLSSELLASKLMFDKVGEIFRAAWKAQT
jgi:hypothetical protein